MDRRLILLLGGARSGKSHRAEAWARTHGRHVLFVATAEMLDDEMRSRVAFHRASRPAEWTTLEVARQAGAAIRSATGAHDTVVVDCLTLLAANALLALPANCEQAQANQAVLQEVDALLEAYAASRATWLVISNEVGMGIVPPTRLGRAFRDALGAANQRMARAADEVQLLVAGIPWVLKPQDRAA